MMLLVLAAGSRSHAQWALGPVGGFDFGAKSNVIAGIGYAYPLKHVHGQKVGDAGISLGVGYGIYKPHLFMPQFGAWWAGLFSFGLKVGVYTDFNRTSILAVPEIGFGLGGFRFVWGFPTVMNNVTVEGLNTSQFSVYFFHPFHEE
jgi:hypothetical protein